MVTNRNFGNAARNSKALMNSFLSEKKTKKLRRNFESKTIRKCQFCTKPAGFLTEINATLQFIPQSQPIGGGGGGRFRIWITCGLFTNTETDNGSNPFPLGFSLDWSTTTVVP